MLRVFFKGQMEINSLKTQCFDWLKFFIPQLVIKELRFLILASSSKWENHIKILWRWRDSSCAARIPPEFYFRAKQSIKKEGWWSFSGGLLRNMVLQSSVQGLSAGMHCWGSHLSWEWLCFLYIIFLQVCRYFTHVGMYVFICVWGFFYYLQVRFSPWMFPTSHSRCRTAALDVRGPGVFWSSGSAFLCSGLLCSRWGAGFSPSKSTAWETSL